MQTPMRDITEEARRAVAGRRRPPRMPEVGTYQDAKQIALEKATRPRDDARMCKTGMARIDYITGGIRPRFCWLIGGDTNVGKSTFAVSVAVHNLMRGLPVLIVSAEDPIEMYGSRFLCREVDVDGHGKRLSAIRLRDGRLRPDELEAVKRNVSGSVPWPVYLSADGVTIEEVAPWVEWAIEEYDIRLVVWDYLQEFTTNSREQDDRLRTKAKAKLIRTIARSTNTAEITLSQLTLTEKTGIPTRQNIRDCRDAAHGADVIGLLYEPPRQAETDPPRRAIFLDKVKDGPAKVSVDLDWDPASASFLEMRPTAADEYSYHTETVCNELTSDFDNYYDPRAGN